MPTPKQSRSRPGTVSWIDDLPDDLLFRIFVAPLGARAMLTCKTLARVLCKYDVIADVIRRCGGRVCTISSDPFSCGNNDLIYAIERPVRNVDAFILNKVLSDPFGYVSGHAIHFYDESIEQYVDGTLYDCIRVDRRSLQSVKREVPLPPPLAYVRDFEQTPTQAIVRNGMASHIQELTISGNIERFDQVACNMPGAFANVRLLRLCHVVLPDDEGGYEPYDEARYEREVETWRLMGGIFPNVVELDTARFDLSASWGNLFEGFIRSSLLHAIKVLTVPMSSLVFGVVLCDDVISTFRANPLAFGQLHTLRIVQWGDRIGDSPLFPCCMTMRHIRNLEAYGIDFLDDAYIDHLIRRREVHDTIESILVHECTNHHRLREMIQSRGGTDSHFSRLKRVIGFGPSVDFIDQS